MFNETMFVDMIEIEVMNAVVWVGGNSDRGEDVGNGGVEVDGLGERVDGHGFGDPFAGVWKDVVVCEGVDHWTW